MTTVFTIITVIFAAVAVINAASTAYWNRQTARIMAGLPKQPKPWYVRATDKLFP